jgi:hypothetical protein
MDLITYNSTLTSVINRYRPLINPFSSDYTILDRFFAEIQQTTGASDHFFVKSFLSQLLSYDRYISTGILETASANCKFTSALVSKNGVDRTIFLKVVTYKSQDHLNFPREYKDLILFDIISAIILEHIANEANNSWMKEHLPTYRGSFLSYVDTNKWNYNDLLFLNTLSPYNYNKLGNEGNNNPNYADKAMILINDAIKDFKSFGDVFSDFKFSPSPEGARMMQKALYGCSELYKMLILIGINYGFIHNDLHTNNILFDLNTNKIIMIDFGRASFVKYIYTEDASLNNIVLSEAFKLNYNELYPSFEFDSYKKIHINNQLFNHRLSYAKPGGNGHFGFVFDIITLSLNIYAKLLFCYGNLSNPQFYSAFHNVFKKVINIVPFQNNDLFLVTAYDFNINTADTLDNLFENYLQAKEFINRMDTNRVAINVSERDAPKLKILFNYVIDGLLLTALLMFHKQALNFRINANSVNQNPYFWGSLQVTSNCKLNEFYTYIENLFQDNQHPQYATALCKIEYICFIFTGRNRRQGGSSKKLKSYTSKSITTKNNEVFSKKSDSKILEELKKINQNYKKNFENKEKTDYFYSNKDIKK